MLVSEFDFKLPQQLIAQEPLSDRAASRLLHLMRRSGEFVERTLRFEATAGGDFFSIVERLGHIPLPPYIDRPDTPQDRERYQTVFAKSEKGSVAAPTAGLHFTPEILEQIHSRGIETA